LTVSVVFIAKWFIIVLVLRIFIIHRFIRRKRDAMLLAYVV
jgi:hypothetical protein